MSDDDHAAADSIARNGTEITTSVNGNFGPATGLEELQPRRGTTFTLAYGDIPDASTGTSTPTSALELQALGLSLPSSSDYGTEPSSLERLVDVSRDPIFAAELALAIQGERERVDEALAMRDSAVARLETAYVSVRQKASVIKELEEELGRMKIAVAQTQAEAQTQDRAGPRTRPRARGARRAQEAIYDESEDSDKDQDQEQDRSLASSQDMSAADESQDTSAADDSSCSGFSGLSDVQAAARTTAMVSAGTDADNNELDFGIPDRGSSASAPPGAISKGTPVELQVHLDARRGLGGMLAFAGFSETPRTPERPTSSPSQFATPSQGFPSPFSAGLFSPTFQSNQSAPSQGHTLFRSGHGFNMQSLPPIGLTSEESIDARKAIFASLPSPMDMPDDDIKPILLPHPYTLHELLGNAPLPLRNLLSQYRLLYDLTTYWCPDHEEHGYYLAPLFRCSTNPRVITAHRWTAVDVIGPTSEPIECFYNTDGKWYYAGVYRLFRMDDLTTQEWDALSHEAAQALVKETVAARKNVSPQNLYEIGQLYAAGALKVGCVGLQCIGFNGPLYSAIREYADTLTRARKLSADSTRSAGSPYRAPIGPGPGSPRPIGSPRIPSVAASALPAPIGTGSPRISQVASQSAAPPRPAPIGSPRSVMGSPTPMPRPIGSPQLGSPKLATMRRGSNMPPPGIA